MKNITEFNVFNLNRALAVKTDLATQGKTPEEISAGIGEAFKLEGDKLKAFVASLDLIVGKTDGLKRVFVVTFAEGETVPASVQKVEEQHFLLDYYQAPRPAVKPEDAKGKGRRGGRDSRGGPRKDGDRKGPGGPGGGGGGKDAKATKPPTETKS